MSYSLFCAKTSGGSPQFTIVGGDGQKVASALIVGTDGHAKAQLRLGGGATIAIPVSAVDFDTNEMDGGWTVTMSLGSPEIFDGLTDRSSEGASLTISGKRFPLAPQKGDGKKLVAWKNACEALKAEVLSATAVGAKPDCDFNYQLYRAPLYKDPDQNSYQELQFKDGAAEGSVDLTEYRKGNAVWTSHGTFTCSNGVSICRLSFPLMLGQAVELPYEIVNDDKNSPEMVVIPSLAQEVYQTEQYAVMQGKSYGGLVANFLNGFTLKQDELTHPYNVYRYMECKAK